MHKAKDIAYLYAQLIKSKCPSLQFIRIEKWAWQFVAPIDLASIIVGDNYTKIELRELDYDEKSVIELFAITDLASQSGLPMPEPVNEHAPSEEEQERFQRLMEDMEVNELARGLSVLDDDDDNDFGRNGFDEDDGLNNDDSDDIYDSEPWY